MFVDASANAADPIGQLDEQQRKLLNRLTSFIAERLERRGAETVRRGNDKSSRRFAEANVELAQKDFRRYVFDKTAELQLRPGPLRTLVQEYYLIATFIPEAGTLLRKHEWVQQMQVPSRGRINQFLEDFKRYCAHHPLED